MLSRRRPLLTLGALSSLCFNPARSNRSWLRPSRWPKRLMRCVTWLRVAPSAGSSSQSDSFDKRRGIREQLEGKLHSLLVQAQWPLSAFFRFALWRSCHPDQRDQRGRTQSLSSIAELKASGELGRSCRFRSVAYINNVLEPDHRFVNKRVASQSFQWTGKGQPSRASPVDHPPLLISPDQIAAAFT